jgi:hypothetical protein
MFQVLQLVLFTGVIPIVPLAKYLKNQMAAVIAENFVMQQGEDFFKRFYSYKS